MEQFCQQATCPLSALRYKQFIKYVIPQALEMGADEGKCLFRRGLCRFQLGDLTKAREDLERALQLNPGDAGIVKQLKVRPLLRSICHFNAVSYLEMHGLLIQKLRPREE
jgi:hypothetical protein